jgi:hypothetical protein
MASPIACTPTRRGYAVWTAKIKPILLAELKTA